ncbi:MAG: TRAP transporter large permease subunit [Deltaproteobacteria bacterium]|nr:TRAP transporter large permease subunit [Deltaproteobacteria bacterium]
MNRFIVLSGILFLYIVLGCIMDGFAMIILTIPILFPILTSMGSECFHTQGSSEGCPHEHDLQGHLALPDLQCCSYYSNHDISADSYVHSLSHEVIKNDWILHT